MSYDPFVVYDNPGDGIAYIYPNPAPTPEGKASFLERAIFRIGDWRKFFPISGLVKLLVCNTRGVSAILGISRSSDFVNPYPGAMETYGGYFVGIKDDEHAMDAGGSYSELRIENALGTGAAAEFSVQVAEGIVSSIPSPFETFEPGLKAHGFGAFFSTSGTRWPYATNSASAAAYVVASRNAVTGKTAGFNRGFVFGHDSINEIAGHRVAHFLAAGQDVAWRAPGGNTLYLTSDGENLLVTAGDKKFKVALTPL